MKRSLDEEFMTIALDEARKSYERNDFPVGAVLVIDGILVGKGNNTQFTRQDWYSHAESQLIGKHASEIKKASKQLKSIHLYTTLEPCLMCLGTSVMNRISRIIYACPDPFGGVCGMKPPTDWYEKKWPSIEHGILKDKSYNYLISYMISRKDWEDVLQKFETMGEKSNVSYQNNRK